MTIQILTPENRPTVKWTSGTSTEIFIYPAGSSFAERSFQFRISSATVEAEESEFTFFKGITRHLMLLKGELELIHEGRYTRFLEPFEQDTFSGEWTTRSRGRVVDFNLMHKENATGALSHLRLAEGSRETFAATTPFYFVYVAAGVVSLENGDTARSGDLICFGKEAAVTVFAKSPCDLISIGVKLS